MITKLQIENFKSVKSVDLDCRRVNLLIGEPNTGKSNILEALGLLSWCARFQPELKDYVRLELAQDLFHDRLLDEPIRIFADGAEAIHVSIAYESDAFQFHLNEADKPFAQINHKAGGGGGPVLAAARSIRFYRFQKRANLNSKKPGANGVSGYTQITSQIRGVKQLCRPGGKRPQKHLKLRQIADVAELSNIALQVGLEIPGMPERRFTFGLRPQFRKSSAEKSHPKSRAREVFMQRSPR